MLRWRTKTLKQKERPPSLNADCVCKKKHFLARVFFPLCLFLCRVLTHTEATRGHYIEYTIVDLRVSGYIRWRNTASLLPPFDLTFTKGVCFTLSLELIQSEATYFLSQQRSEGAKQSRTRRLRNVIYYSLLTTQRTTNYLM